MAMTHERTRAMLQKQDFLVELSSDTAHTTAFSAILASSYVSNLAEVTCFGLVELKSTQIHCQLEHPAQYSVYRLRTSQYPERALNTIRCRSSDSELNSLFY